MWKDEDMRVNLNDFLHEAAAGRPDSEALAEYRDGQRRSLSWAEFAEASDKISRALSAYGLVAGNRVGLIMANSVDLAVAYFGVLHRGLVAVPMNPRSTAHEIGQMASDSGARVVLADAAGSDHRAQLGNAVVVADSPGADIGWTDFVSAASDTCENAPADPEALAILLYTSGTSGRPRAAMLSHRALIANIEQIARLEPAPLTPDDACLVLLPLFHIYGLNAILGQAVAQRSRCVFVDGFEPDALLQLIVNEKITNVPIAPPVIAAWAGRDNVAESLAGVRTIISGAAALDPDLVIDFERTCGKRVEQGYGFTEAAPVVTTTLGRGAHEPRPQPGSVGKPLPGIDMVLREPAGTEASNGDPAEIWVRGENLFSGYWPDGNEGPTRDGWYATGDIGYLDGHGDLTLVDRLPEMIIVSGFNVYPTEVEEIIVRVHGVRQVAVVGAPDSMAGERVLAFVVPADHAVRDAAADMLSPEVDALTPKLDAFTQKIAEHCRSRLARFKQPSEIIPVRHLPTSATGKVAKGRLRALARSQTLGLDLP